MLYLFIIIKTEVYYLQECIAAFFFGGGGGVGGGGGENYTRGTTKFFEINLLRTWFVYIESEQ